MMRTVVEWDIEGARVGVSLSPVVATRPRLEAAFLMFVVAVDDDGIFAGQD